MKQGVAVDARVWTARSGQDTGMQLREYVHRRGWEIVGDYFDVEISGSGDRDGNGDQQGDSPAGTFWLGQIRLFLGIRIHRFWFRLFTQMRARL